MVRYAQGGGALVTSRDTSSCSLQKLINSVKIPVYPFNDFC